MGCRKQDVVKDQPIAGAVGVEAEVSGGIVDAVGVVLRIVAAKKSERPLPVGSMQVLDLVTAGRCCQYDHCIFYFVFLIDSTLPVRPLDTAAVSRAQHGPHG